VLACSATIAAISRRAPQHVLLPVAGLNAPLLGVA
jgi:hypothetical protein